MKYSEAIEFLNSFYDYEKIALDPLKERFNLGFLREILKKIGDPDKSYRSVHIAGTKGKGSISVFTSNIIAEAGYRTGLYISPHVSDIRERISVDDRVISEKDFAQTVRALLSSAGALLDPEKLSYFEVLTLVAMLHFKMKEVEVAVFECGMGGRLDATNVITPVVCGFAPISHDHVQILGTKITEIAGEKAAIIKKGARCVTARQEPEVLKIIKDKCREQNASLSIVGSDVTCGAVKAGPGGTSFDIYGRYGNYNKCHTRMVGYFQAENCAAAVGICEELKDAGIVPVSSDAVKKGVSRAFLPGRLEILSRDPRIVIDGAQNADSAAKLKYSIEQIFKYDRLILLLGLSADKDIKGVCREFKGFADEFIITRAQVRRAADPDIIRGYLKGENAAVTGNVAEAIGLAFKRAREKDMVLVAGSFFLAGEVREIVHRLKGQRQEARGEK
ncbi:MAG: bifunctional folylpolyglutamate synthase/dihydrofolate synthase [Candidatus Omnitrophica bacterium]|nr:bifunctional folylpolyglutamate synthase/dihydrofolate synthase [Candidatus Omnitrophota bacterium]